MLNTDILQAAEKQKVVRKSADRAKKRRAYFKGSSETSHLDQLLYSISKLKTLISFKERNTDTWQQPKNKMQLMKKWNEIKNRETPSPSLI